MQYDHNELLSISDFSNLTGISRANLIFYDKENLLKPIHRDHNNGYRKYHFSQITVAYLIQVYRQVGLSLPQINELLTMKSVEDERVMLKSHIDNIDKQIKYLEQQKYNMKVYEENLLKYGNRNNKNRFTVEEMPGENMYLSKSLRKIEEDVSTMNGFLMYIRSQGIPMDCHIGRMFTKRTFDSKKWEYPEYVYFKKLHGTYKRKKGLYLIYTTYTDGSNINDIYDTFFEYIKSHNYIICGNIYEDYPLSSILASSGDTSMLRIMVPINI